MSAERDKADSKAENNGIEVYLRVRPSKKPSGYFSRDDIDENQIAFDVPKNEKIYVNNSRTRFGFHFSGVLDDNASQEDVFRTVGAPAVKNALDGFNSTVFAYGQTGSGKTFTITGGAERYIDRGIIPRAISMLFGSFQQQKDTSFSCFVSYLELYNEAGYDLLAEEHAESTKLEDMQKVNMMEDEDGNFHFRNLSVHQVASEEEALNFLFLGDTNRAIGETEMNQASSRSHCIFTLMIEARKASSDTVVRSKLNLVDLAGSERVHKTSSSGQTLREAQYINTSLFYLEMVIVALHEKTKKGKEKTHVPYRNSMMTSVLRDSLGGNCKTMMIATIAPEAKQTGESISTCNFAQRVALIKNRAQVNEDLEPELIIRRLKAEVHRLREEVKYLKGENGEGDDLSPDQRTDLVKAVEEYVDDSNEHSELNIGTMTLTKIRDAFGILKDLVGYAREKGSSDGACNTDVEKELASLKKTLVQRDREIAILVKMVKEGKGGKGVVTKATQNAHDPARPSCGIKEELEASSGGGARTDTQANPAPAPPRKVCGVERCSSREVLDEPSAAFEWFRERYPGVEAIEENKGILKEKYAEAKETGEMVQKCRSRINYHKGTIERLRRDRAMEGITSCELDEQDNEGKVESLDEPHPEECEHREAIETQKTKYKEGFTRLRELKGNIEHLQRLMEKGRSKMQADFDVWYREMCGEPHQSVGAYMRMAREEEKQQECHGPEQELLGPKPTKSVHEASTSSGSPPGQHVRMHPPGATHKMTLTTANAKSNVAPQPPKKADTFQLPPGVKLTGNREADEDIIAFYKAKELLLARTKRPP